MRQSLIYGLEPWKASGCIRFAKSNRINFNQSLRYKDGSLTAVTSGEQVVPASELAAAMKQIKELQRMLGKKTMEVELLREAVDIGRQKKWIAHVPLLPEDGE
ncbi:Transposase [Klebsiella pneumoniae]